MLTGLKLRGLLLQTDDDAHTLVVTTHHVAADGWSVLRIAHEVGELYNAAVGGSTAMLPELPIQYADFAAWQREQLASAALDDQLSYWEQHLAGPLPVLDLPTDHPRPSERTYAGGQYRFNISDDVMTALRRVSAGSDVTPFTFLLASYVATLARHAGQQDVVVGTAAANRAHSEVADLVGLFVNTLALRISLDSDDRFEQLLEVVKRAVLDGFAHQDVPFDRIVQAVNPPRDLSRSPIFQTMFVYNNMSAVDLRLEGLEVAPVDVSTEAIDVDLSTLLADTPTGTIGIIEFNTDVFDRETIERLVEHWLVLLAAAVADPRSPVASWRCCRRRSVSCWCRVERDRRRRSRMGCGSTSWCRRRRRARLTRWRSSPGPSR